VGLEEVVVTAEKRETTESKTPIAMDVLSATQLQEQGVHDLATLSQVDPSLQFARTEHGYQYAFGAPRTSGIKLTANFK
jgi:hypothetical protein